MDHYIYSIKHNLFFTETEVQKDVEELQQKMNWAGGPDGTWVLSNQGWTLAQ